MTAKTLGVVAVVLAAGAIVGVKMTRERPAEAAVASRAEGPSVVLVADSREADTDCGCGRIIRRVREAKARGVAVLEIGPADPAAARYRVTVAPTVLFLGPDGSVVSRRDGESGDAVTAISADLARLEDQKR